MTDTVGLRLDTACERLRACGYEVETVLVSSKKGQQGNELRVIKQELIGNRAIIYYSHFITQTT